MPFEPLRRHVRPDAAEVAVVGQIDLEIGVEDEGAVYARRRWSKVLQGQVLRAIPALAVRGSEQVHFPSGTQHPNRDGFHHREGSRAAPQYDLFTWRYLEQLVDELRSESVLTRG